VPWVLNPALSSTADDIQKLATAGPGRPACSRFCQEAGELCRLFKELELEVGGKGHRPLPAAEPLATSSVCWRRALKPLFPQQGEAIRAGKGAAESHPSWSPTPNDHAGVPWHGGFT